MQGSLISSKLLLKKELREENPGCKNTVKSAQDLSKESNLLHAMRVFSLILLVKVVCWVSHGMGEVYIFDLPS